MPEGQAPVKDQPEKTENEQAPETVTEADVLEEDDDFEDFEHEGQFNIFTCPRKCILQFICAIR